MVNEGFKTKLQRVLALSIFTMAWCGISWFCFDQILIYTGTKVNVPDPTLNFTRLVVSIILVTISYAALKWEDWHTPNL